MRLDMQVATDELRKILPCLAVLVGVRLIELACRLFYAFGLGMGLRRIWLLGKVVRQVLEMAIDDRVYLRRHHLV